MIIIKNDNSPESWDEMTICDDCRQENCICEHCAGCGIDLTTVSFDKLLVCDKCRQSTCEDCATIRPVKNDIVDEILCVKCK